MIGIWRVELREGIGNDDDWGSMNHTVVAKSYKEAWKKALAIEPADNIKRIWATKWVPERGM